MTQAEKEQEYADLLARVYRLEEQASHPPMVLNSMPDYSTVLQELRTDVGRIAEVLERVGTALNLRFGGGTSLPVAITSAPIPPMPLDNSWKLDMLTEALNKLAMAFDPSLKPPASPEPPMAPFEGR